MNRCDFRYLDPLRVRWAEIDMQKIVFNSHYLMYFDTAAAGYWRALALPYHEAMQRLGGDLYVRKATLEYEGSARYDDACDVGIRAGRIGNTSMVLHAAVFRGEQRLVHGELVYVFADPATQTPVRVPDALRQWLQAYEAGEPMLEVRLGSLAELGREAGALRDAVFGGELGLPRALERDDADASALHAVAFNRLGMALGTARLVQGEGGAAQLGRLAVMPALRGSGIGQALVGALADAARARGAKQLVAHAQAGALPFFRHAGFVECGARYEAAGILHVPVTRPL